MPVISDFHGARSILEPYTYYTLHGSLNSKTAFGLYKIMQNSTKLTAFTSKAYMIKTFDSETAF